MRGEAVIGHCGISDIVYVTEGVSTQVEGSSRAALKAYFIHWVEASGEIVFSQGPQCLAVWDLVMHSVRGCVTM